MNILRFGDWAVCRTATRTAFSQNEEYIVCHRCADLQVKARSQPGGKLFWSVKLISTEEWRQPGTNAGGDDANLFEIPFNIFNALRL